MERKELDFVLKHNHYFKGGTKEACVKVRDFLNCVESSENQIHSALSCVTVDEFVETVKTLMAFTFQQEDSIPEKWRCDSDCRQVTSSSLCPGEFNISKTADKMCPFFIDEGLI